MIDSKQAEAQRSEWRALEENTERESAECARLQAALAEARALLIEAGPLIGASSGWPGRRAAWLEANP